MVNPELIDYIKSVRAQGYSDDAIKEHLGKHGYDQMTIDNAFARPEINTQIKSVIEKHKKEKKKKNVLKIIIPIVVIIIIVLVGGIIYLRLKAKSECDNVVLDVHKINNNPVLCAFPDNTKIQTILVNDGSVLIKEAEILIKGSKGKVLENIENINLGPGEISTHVIDFDNSNGEIQQVSNSLYKL